MELVLPVVATVAECDWATTADPDGKVVR